MFVVTKAKPLATTITGSLPRPHWFTENLHERPFLSAFNGDAIYREQCNDAVAALISNQTKIAPAASPSWGRASGRQR
jgi:5-methyltetrahydropteroyltriglutamate--homocysteine methyltransferase